MFFRKGLPTEETWIYDLRTNIEKVTKGHPLTDDYFRDFEECYNQKPRKESERFKRFTRKEIENRDYNLDIIWLKDSSCDSGNLLEPSELANEAIAHLETALNSLNDLVSKLGNGKSKM
jgi:type I restriction enzyme M protein